MRKITHDERSIVMLGRFNPAIFHPSWFARMKLLRDEEMETAKIGIVHNDVTDFATEWFRLLVQADKFQVASLQSGRDEEIRDLVLGTFELLAHTPIQAMGINGAVHFSVESPDEWHRIGHQLAPKEGLWDSILSNPGTRMVAIEGARTDGRKGRVLVRVGPSQLLPNGIWVDVNDHFAFEESEKIPSAQSAVKTLNEVWNDSKNLSKKIINRMMAI